MTLTLNIKVMVTNQSR